MAYVDEVLNDSPVLYWRLGESSGPTAEDATANNRDGTYTGCTFSQAGALVGDADTGVLFDGVDDRVQRVDEPALDLGDTFTMEAWVKRASIGAIHAIMGKGIGTYLLRFNSDDTLHLLQSQTADIVGSTITITDTSAWHHVVGTKAGAAVFLYIDGADVTGTVSNATCADSGTEFRVGCDTGGGVPETHFHGSIDEAALYPTALSPARVLAHYLSGVALDEPGPALRFVQSGIRLV